MRKKKIDLIIGSLRAGGAERVVVNLANYFSKLNHEVRIITFNAGGEYKLESGVELVVLRKLKFIPFTILRASFELLNFYFKKNNRPDIINTHISLMCLSAFLSSKLYGIHLISSEHSNHLQVENQTLNKLLWDFIYPKINAITILTGYDEKFFSKRNSNVVLMGNPCSFKPYVNDEERNKVILGVGSMDRYDGKGFDTLISICSKILPHFPNWKLVLVGSGEEGLMKLGQIAENLKISEQVDFTGFRNDINKIMSQSEIFVLSSKYEGLPMALLEAMSQGMACISYDCISGPADIIDHNKNGLLIENQNQLELQLGIKKLIEDDELRKKLQKRAPNSISKYSMENVGNKWLKLIHEVCEN